MPTLLKELIHWPVNSIITLVLFCSNNILIQKIFLWALNIWITIIIQREISHDPDSWSTKNALTMWLWTANLWLYCHALSSTVMHSHAMHSKTLVNTSDIVLEVLKYFSECYALSRKYFSSSWTISITYSFHCDNTQREPDIQASLPH